MPSLWKREKSPYWVCCYTTADGRRLKKSTKQADRAKALEVCLSIERAERFAKAGTLTEQVAKKIIGEIVERTSGERLNDYTVTAWLAEWLAGKTDSKSANTATRYKQCVRDFLASMGARQKLSISHVTAADIRRFREAETGKGKAAKSANLGVKIISAAFNAALRQGHITHNPCLALEGLPEVTAERDTFTPAQVAKLLQTAQGDWKGAILFAYFTGARLGDVAGMRWSAVDLKKQIVSFTPGKTGKPLVLPLHPDLEAHLLKAPGIGRAFLFPSLAGKPTGGKTGLSGQFAEIMAAAGIVGTITRHTAEGRANNSLSFHALRHSFNSAMANAGVSQELRQKLTGHASAEMNRIYTHHELAPLRAAIETLPSLASK